MAEQGHAFSQLKTTSKRFGAPWIAIVFMVTIISLLFLLTNNDWLVNSVVSASASWLLAHIKVLVLRRRLPANARPRRMPFHPLPQIIGIIGMGCVVLHNSPLPEMTAMVYTITGGIPFLISVLRAL